MSDFGENGRVDKIYSVRCLTALGNTVIHILLNNKQIKITKKFCFVIKTGEVNLNYI